MKRIALLSLSLLSFTLKAQEPKLLTIETTDRLLTGSIDDQYDITVYLKAVNRSDNNGGVFSLTGWYSYDNVGTPIPLAGLYGWGMHLFTSEDASLLESLTNFEYNSDGEIRYLDSDLNQVEAIATEIKGISERFYLEYEDRRYKGQWHQGEKVLDVYLRSASPFIEQTKVYIELPNGSYFDLSNMGIPPRTLYELEATSNGGQHILLHYRYHANLNYMGRCGGAENSGKIALVFDSDFSLERHTLVEFENCYRDITLDELNKVSETVTEYTIVDYGGSSKDKVYSVDFERATITEK